MDKDGKETGVAVPVLAADAVEAVVSSLQMDFLVEETSMFRGSAFVWRQFVINGQILQVRDKTSVVLAGMPTAQASLVELSPSDNTFQLMHANQSKLTLLCPSPTARDKFTTALELSAYDPYWVLHRSDYLGQLVQVAKVIVETDAACPNLSVRASPVRANDVAAYLARIKPTFDRAMACSTKQQLFDYLCQLEAEYMADRASVDNFAHVVHRMYPDYAKTDTRPCRRGAAATACPYPHCRVPLTADQTFSMYVMGQSVRCRICRCDLSMDTFRLAAFLRDFPTFPLGTTTDTTPLTMPLLHKNSSRESYERDVLRAVFWYETQTKSTVGATDRHALSTALARYFERVDLVLAMAKHLQSLAPICSNWDYWSHPAVVDAAIVRYNQFVHLVEKAPAAALLPTMDIALVRFVHQSLERLPALSLPKSAHMAAAYAETFVQWSDQFNQAYSSFPPSFTAWSNAANALSKATLLRKKWNQCVRLPSMDSRFVGVEVHHGHLPRDGVLWTPDDDACFIPDDSLRIDFAAVLGTPVMDDRVVQPSNDPVLRLHSGQTTTGSRRQL
ncbi:hypothetical protein AC1031_012211 [Aphanomyces cochlioides]|nr:hypothetical protein AC1031_012211 [Aphanomyces cochlioides]